MKNILLFILVSLPLISCMRDSIEPSFLGIENKNIIVGKIFNPLAGISANDNVDGDITNNIVIEGVYNENSVGSYPITYKVKDKAGNETVKTIILTVSPEPVGNLKGNITWKYNNFVGHKPDTGSEILLIPKDKNIKDINPYLEKEDLEKLGVYYTKVNGSGNYEISEITSGSYYLIISSKNTNREFQDDEINIPAELKKMFSTDGYKLFDAVFISSNKYIFKEIVIETAKTLDYSHDFGNTYW